VIKALCYARLEEDGVVVRCSFARLNITPVSLHPSDQEVAPTNSECLGECYMKTFITKKRPSVYCKSHFQFLLVRQTTPVLSLNQVLWCSYVNETVPARYRK
jgi:hypothetical protein